MKALTIRRPWAGAILLGGKDVENRTWKTSFRGRLLIHAGRGMDDGAVKPRTWQRISTPLDFAGGALIGFVELTDCVPGDECQWEWSDQVGWSWLLREPRVFLEPIPLRGQLYVFDVDDDLVRRSVRQAITPQEWLRQHQERVHYGGLAAAAARGEQIR